MKMGCNGRVCSRGSKRSSALTASHTNCILGYLQTFHIETFTRFGNCVHSYHGCNQLSAFGLGLFEFQIIFPADALTKHKSIHIGVLVLGWAFLETNTCAACLHLIV